MLVLQPRISIERAGPLGTVVWTLPGVLEGSKVDAKVAVIKEMLVEVGMI
jgi:hypothetical protein